MATIDRSALSGLIPEPVTREIMQGAIAESAVLRMGRRLANMSSKTQTIIRGTTVKRNPAVTCEAASRYDAAEIENSPPEDPEEAIRQKILRKLEEAERRRCS